MLMCKCRLLAYIMAYINLADECLADYTCIQEPLACRKDGPRGSYRSFVGFHDLHLGPSWDRDSQAVV